VCSRGRSFATLTALCLAGYLTPVANRNDRRLRPLLPTEQPVVACRQYCKALFVGTARVIRTLQRQRGTREYRVTGCLYVRIRDVFLCWLPPVSRGSKLTAFAHRSAGLGVLCSMLLACEPPDPVGRRRFPLSIAVLARHFGVSRTQCAFWTTPLPCRSSKVASATDSRFRFCRRAWTQWRTSMSPAFRQAIITCAPRSMKLPARDDPFCTTIAPPVNDRPVATRGGAGCHIRRSSKPVCTPSALVKVSDWP
jgi:hypothetical protein